MKINKPKNPNYCATVVEIKNILPLEGCDNVVATSIMGNQVIIGKDVKVGDIGLYFPLETQLSKEYLSANNLYRNKDLNLNKDKAGYFEENGRIRCVKFRGHKSEGLYMPLYSVMFCFSGMSSNKLLQDFGLNIGDDFDELNGVEICRKYVVQIQRIPGQANSKQKGKQKGKQPKKISKLIENQFRFHQDTSMLYKNLHKISPGDIISITTKIHGTSGISSKILCKRQLKPVERILKRLGVKIDDKQYDYVNSSRKVIKNSDLCPNPGGFYKEDIWSIADKELISYLQDGMTLYYEIVGFLPSGMPIQKLKNFVYDYRCEEKEHKIFIYRITYTNPSGRVFEFSARQVQEWCKQNGLNAVEEMYYGKAKDFVGYFFLEEEFRSNFLAKIKEKYNEHDCHICKNNVPEEGVVIRIEKNEFEAYKCKSNRFYTAETESLDKGETNLEDQN
jgi:hypothetical protein